MRPEQIIAMLAELAALQARGAGFREVCKELDITDLAFYPAGDC